MTADEYGQVLEVSTLNVGSSAAANASIGATTLTLTDVSMFEESGGQVTVDGILYYYDSVSETAAGGGGGSTAIEVTVGESAWNTTTSPKTVTLPGCVAGDWLAVIAGGDQVDIEGVSAATSSTTAGSTTAWSELAEDLDTGTDAEWYHAAAAQVTAAGSVTIQVSRTQAGTASGRWGFLVIRGRNSAGVNLLGQRGASGSTQTINGAPSAGSTVVTAFFDWNASTPPTAWTPAGQTVIESAQYTNLTVAAAYWTGQPTGFRGYGSTDFTSNRLKGVGLELLAVPAVADPLTTTGTMILQSGLTVAAVADETRVDVYPPAPIRTALVAFGIEEGEAVRVTVPYYVDLPDGLRPTSARENVLVEERNPGELYLKDLPATGMILLESAEDLDDYTSAGNFIQRSSANAAGGLNFPVPYAGVLEVISTQPADVLTQRYTAYRNAVDASAPSMWVRTFGDSVWSTWRPVHDDTGWVTSVAAIAVAQTGWSIGSASLRRVGKHVVCRIVVDRTGAALTVSTTGSVAGAPAVFQMVAAYRPGSGAPLQGGFTGTNVRDVGGRIDSTGIFNLANVSGSVNIATGDQLVIAGSYYLN